jgi:hypothetical protein
MHATVCARFRARSGWEGVMLREELTDYDKRTLRRVVCCSQKARRTAYTREDELRRQRKRRPIVSLSVPILHAGGFSWDEAIILVIAILAVPAISWFTGRVGKRAENQSPSPRHRRPREPTSPSDDTSPVE